ncbi:MAG: glycosyltransferase family 2 protein [Gammaproteobacteria bacterium]|nr:glycosyltransferase family 2 protein [Gammaproteobacteria bacterium]
MATRREAKQCMLAPAGLAAWGSEGPMQIDNTKVAVSIVVPFLDERPTLQPIWEEIREALALIDLSFEAIFVDDGSEDGSLEEALAIAENDGRVRVLKLRRHMGKTEALAAGFPGREGQGDRDDGCRPAGCTQRDTEVPWRRSTEGFDVVCGWKRERRDSFVKILQSRLFNYIISKVSGVRLHDHNCGFKAMRSEVAKRLDLYGEQHRLITVLADMEGFRVGEIPVRHRARRHGASKYGWGRVLDGLLDLMTVVVAIRYRARPLHAFGKLGLLFLLVGVLAGMYRPWCGH